MISLKKNLNKNIRIVVFNSLQEFGILAIQLNIKADFYWLDFFPIEKKPKTTEQNTERLTYLVKLPRLDIYHTILPGDCFTSSNFILKSTKSDKIYQRIKKHKCWVSLVCPTPHNQTQARESRPKENPRALSLYTINQRSLSFALRKM